MAFIEYKKSIMKNWFNRIKNTQIIIMNDESLFDIMSTRAYFKKKQYNILLLRVSVAFRWTRNVNRHASLRFYSRKPLFTYKESRF